MASLQYFPSIQPSTPWPETLDPASFTLSNYRGYGWVFEATTSDGTIFWALMTNATIVKFGQLNGTFASSTNRQDIFAADCAISSADFFAVINAPGATGHDVFNLLMNGNDTLNGSSSDDTLVAGLGMDVITGGDGVDKFILASGMHSVTDLGLGGADSFTVAVGADVVLTAAADWAATAETTKQGYVSILASGHSIDLTFASAVDGDGFDISNADFTPSVVLTGSRLADAIVAGLGGDMLRGGDGNDVLTGGIGNDALDGGNGIDTASFASETNAISVNLSVTKPQATGFGKDTFIAIENVIGGSGNDKLAGNALDNSLTGGAGNDTLSGGAGDDILTGGLGKDVMMGGVGADIFVFDSLFDSSVGKSRDVIRYFNAIQGDQIDLRTIDADITAAGDQAFTLVTGDHFHGSAGELIYANSVLSGDVNGDTIADFQISVLLRSFDTGFLL